MSKRLQVILDDEELSEIQSLARSQKLSVAEWVRRALRSAKNSQPAQPARSAERKLDAIRAAIGYDFPTADIDQMLGEIDSTQRERKILCLATPSYPPVTRSISPSWNGIQFLLYSRLIAVLLHIRVFRCLEPDFARLRYDSKPR